MVVDTETTGLGHVDRPPRPDGIVQVGLAWRDREGDVRTWSRTCNPGQQYLAGGRAGDALRINGLTESEILASSPARLVAREVRAVLREIEATGGGPIELRAYNRRFDEPFLRPQPWRFSDRRWGPCIMERAASHLGASYGRLRLSEATVRLGIAWPAGRAHTAASDAHAALLVHEALEGGGRDEDARPARIAAR